MRRITQIIAIVALLLSSCAGNSEKQLSTDLVHNPNSAEGTTNTKMPQMTFEKTEHTFGKLIRGEQVNCSFKFKNTGNAPLIINKVTTSCGCTATSFSDKPYAPGEEGKIDITYNSTGHSGFQHKTATVICNAIPSRTVLHIKASVYGPESY